MKRGKMSGLIFTILFSGWTWAHPVTFKDGFEIQGETQARESRFLGTYSFSPRWSVGLEHFQLRDGKMSPTGSKIETRSLHLNHLVKRWNMEGSQANIYAQAGLGVFTPAGANSHILWNGALQADWESKRYYLEGKYNHVAPRKNLAMDFYTLRAGFAPYVLDKEGINTWMILQWTQLNHFKPQVTPMFRFYFENVLFELGGSLDGDFLFQFMVHL